MNPRACGAARSVPHHPRSHLRRTSVPESVVRLTIVVGAVTRHCSGPLADLVKTLEAAKGRKELVPRLACAPASVLATLPDPASPYGLLSTRSSCPQSVRTVTESTVMVASPPAVLVVVNPASQTNEHCVVVSPGAPSQMIKKSNCAYANHCSLALVTQPVL